MKKPIFTVAVLLVLSAIGSAHADVLPPSTPLAFGKKALLPIIVGPKATDEVKADAATLAQYLGKISGAPFVVQSGDGQSGIAVGLATDFPGLNLATELDSQQDATKREDYVLRSHAKGVLLVGSTDLAVQDAVWDFLYRLGYRQFFPGAHWEVVPSTSALSISADVREHPDYLARRIWYGFGSWKENSQMKAAWDARNRMADGLHIEAGHSYESIIRSNKAEFEKHPEYLSSKSPPKLCVSNPGLRKLVENWALAAFEKNPDRDSISLDPSDGGWPDDNDACQDGKTYKSISDRVVTLANDVAQVINAKYKNKYVAIYAYNMHSPPPTIQVDPHVAVIVATAYIKGGLTFDQIVAGWRKQGAQIIGVRDYYSIFDASQDKPAGPGAANLPAMEHNIPYRYGLGARLLSAEATESWGAAGLEYYLASRLTWNTKANPDAIVNDFFEKAFGPAQKPMREFYKVIDRSTQPLWSKDLIGRMYRALDAANKLTTDPGIKARLDDLTLWTRYSEMLLDWQTTSTDQKADGEAILKFSYRFHRAGMLHDYVLWRHSYNLFGKGTKKGIRGNPFPAATHFNAPRDKNPWMSDEPIPEAEIATYIQNGIKNNPVASFTRVTYSHDLIQPTALHFKAGPMGGYNYTRMEQNLYVWFNDPAIPLKLEVLGGQIAPRANTTLSLFSMEGDQHPALVEAPVDEGEALDNAHNKDGNDASDNDVSDAKIVYNNTNPVSFVDVPNDLQLHSVALNVKEKGLYRLRIVDRGKGAAVAWPLNFPVVIESSKSVQTLLRGTGLKMYFYVPKGTKVVAGFSRASPILLDGDGKVVTTLPRESGYFSVPVPLGQDGKLWQLTRGGQLFLMTVPPYLARSPQEMLVPREVVAADSTHG